MKQAKHTPLAVSMALVAAMAAVPATAQTAQELTRALNARPAGAQAAAPASTRPAPAPQASPQPRPAPTQTAPQPQPTPASATTPAPVSSAPVTPAPEGPASATPVPGAVVEAPAAPPPVRRVPLNSAAVAALPFRIDLRGAQIVERPAGPRAKIYSVSRAEKPLLMIYAGPQSDYPIYEGEQALVAGRTSVILSEGGHRRAVEHLFRSDDQQPADLHVWLITTDGPDGALAEQIGQSIDPR